MDENTIGGTVSRKHREHLILVLVSILITLLLLELGVRILLPRPIGMRKWYDMRKSEVDGLGYEPVPNSSFILVYDQDPYGTLPKDLQMVHKINSMGMRGPEWPPLQDDGAIRVLVIGDSFAFGEGVAYENIFPTLIEERLQERSPSDVRYRVLNAAVSGYGTSQELVQLERLIPIVQPRTVLVAYVLNDPIMDDGSPMIGDDDLIHQNEKLKGGIFQSLKSSSVLLRHTTSALSSSHQTEVVEEWYRSYYVGDHQDQWEKASGELERMSQLCRERDIGFIVVVFPLFHDLKDYPFRDVHDTITSFCRDHGIEVIDLMRLFEGMTTQELWVHPLDHHPNARAHGLVADALMDIIRSQTVNGTSRT